MSESETMLNKRDRRCTAVQQMLSTDPSYNNRTITSTLKMQIRTIQRLGTQLNASDDPLEIVERKDTTRKTLTKEFIEKVQAIIDETPHWHIRLIARDLGVSHTTVNACVKDDLKCRSCRRQTSQILTEKTKNLMLIKSISHPRPEPAGLLRLVIRLEHHQHDLQQHQSQPDHRYPPNIRRASVSACGKGMLPVPDPYWGVDWGWRWLHWIDVSLLHNLVTWIDFFSKSFKIKL